MQCIHISVSKIISFENVSHSDWTVTVALSAEVVSAEASRELVPLLSAGVRLRPDPRLKLLNLTKEQTYYII